MPNVGDITRDVTVQSFQSLNGDNQTIAMVGWNYQAGKKVSLLQVAAMTQISKII